MAPETFLGIVCLVLTLAAGAGYRYFIDNVKLTYKDQRIPMEVKKCK